MNKKDLETLLQDTGVSTIQLCYDTFTQLDAVEFARYTELLTVGYNAFIHRKARLMYHHQIRYLPFAYNRFYENSMKRYVTKRMTDYVNKHRVNQPRSGLRRFFS